MAKKKLNAEKLASCVSLLLKEYHSDTKCGNIYLHGIVFPHQLLLSHTHNIVQTILKLRNTKDSYHPKKIIYPVLKLFYYFYKVRHKNLNKIYFSITQTI